MYKKIKKVGEKMAERIEGLTIGLSLDTMKVDTGLASLKSKMSLLGSEMKVNMSAFDRGEKSLKKYGTQLEGLNKRVEAQKISTEAARKTYEKMVTAHGEGSVEAEKAATHYNNQAAALNNLERHVGSVTAEMKEFQRQQEIQGTTLFKVGDQLTNFGTGLKSISDKAGKIGSSLTKKITLPAVGAASALGGIALVKGFGRLVGIDTARAKLKGLGHDATGVENIMKSALESVKGTSYGMDEAATTAANAVAAGIEPGKELTKYLSLTGDAAAIAGAGLGEMGSILNKVQTSNKAYNGELQQLSDRGLPIYQWLAKEAGVAEDAVFDLAKSGKVSSEMLMNAIEKNIGGAAKKMGEESFTAGLSNMWAAVGRIGASFLDAGGKGGGFFSQMKPMIANFTDRIDDIGVTAERVGVKAGEMFTGFIDKMKSLKASYDNLSPSMQSLLKNTVLIGSAFAIGIGPLILGLSKVGGLVANVSLVVGPLLTKMASMGGLLGTLKVGFAALTGPVGLTVAAIAGLTVAGIGLYNHLKKDAIPEVDRFGKGVSKSTKEALTGFFDLSDGASEQLSKMTIKGKSVTQEMADSISGKFSKMNKQILDNMKKQHGEQIKEMESFFLNSSALSNEREEEILRKQKTRNQQREVEQKYAEERIQQILQNAADQKRQLTESEQQQINAIQQKMNETAVVYLTDNEREQKVILERMRATASDLSAKQAAAVVKESATARDKVIADADKKFNDVVAFATKERDETGSISAKEAQDIINEAKKQRDESVKHAQNKHKDVVTEAQKQAKEHVKEVNWETGEILSKWEVMKKGVTDKTTELGKNVKDKFSDMWKTAKEKTSDGVKTVKDGWTDMKNNVTNKAEEMRKNASDKYESLRKSFSDKSQQLKTDTKQKFQDVKGSITSTLTKTREKADEIFGKIVSGATALPGKMKDGIVKMAGLAVDGIKNVGQKMANAFGAVVNGLIGGLNSITKSLGVGGNIPKWNVPKFAYGTDSHKGGLMVVGDKFGRELVELPTGETFLSPDTDTLVNAPKGTRVIPNKITEQYLKGDIPHFAKGAGVMDWVKDKASSLTSALSNVWNYAKNPMKLIDAMGLGKITGFAGGMASMAKGAFGFVKNKASEYLKNMFKKAEELKGDGFGSPFKLTSRYGWRTHPITGVRTFHRGDDYGAPSGTPIPNQVAGTVVNSGYMEGRGNYVRVKSGIMERIYQHNSRNSVRVGQTVSKGQTVGLVGSTGWSTGPHLHYEVFKNGVNIDPNGYATGGYISKPTLSMLAEEGHGEFVIPTDPKRRPDAMKLLALAAKAITGGGGNNAIRPGGLGSSSAGVFGDMLNTLIQQNQMMAEQNSLLMKLLQKSTDVFLDGKLVGEGIYDTVDAMNYDRTSTAAYMKGVRL
ncbi:peptidoglycan DD-metalloendopeptidase family protein [Sporosarcina sp. FSL W7-1283]|uniref:peptidoglycan DD-metalloendopeptidase family protein n=1 Tax=Sporosarcina sp. FSL W7-1283 TaxID=2921560 RepID=UPI0030F942D4